jgi:hypothetical protein
VVRNKRWPQVTDETQKKLYHYIDDWCQPLLGQSDNDSHIMSITHTCIYAFDLSSEFNNAPSTRNKIFRYRLTTCEFSALLKLITLSSQHQINYISISFSCICAVTLSLKDGCFQANLYTPFSCQHFHLAMLKYFIQQLGLFPSRPQTFALMVRIAT